MLGFREAWSLCVSAVFMVAQLFIAGILVGEEADFIAFHDDYQKALEEAKSTGKPIFLEFRCAP